MQWPRITHPRIRGEGEPALGLGESGRVLPARGQCALSHLRRGERYLCEAARHASRTKGGNPEGYFGAFANVYSDAAAVISARRDCRAANPWANSFATARDGVLGMAFIESAVESHRCGGAWTNATLDAWR